MQCNADKTKQHNNNKQHQTTTKTNKQTTSKKVFAIGDEVRETSDSGFLGTVATLHTQLLADGSMLQVHAGGLRHIRPDRRINEWRAPGRRSVSRAASNARQVAVALSGGEVVYFEMDAAGQLLEMAKRDVDGDVACLDLAPVPPGLRRCRFLTVGGYDNAVRVFSLEDGTQLRPVSTQAVQGTPESVLMLYGAGGGGGGAAAGADGGGGGGEDDSDGGGMFLHVGLSNGVLIRTEVDRATGKLSDARQRFLGTRAPRLFAVNVRGRRSMLALSSRPWLGHSDMGRFQIAPLSYEALDHAAAFASEQCPEGFVAVSKGALRILAVDNVGEAFNQVAARLRYTPRRLLVHPEADALGPDAGCLVVAESDHAAVPLAEREDLRERLQAAAAAAAAAAADGGDGAESGAAAANGEGAAAAAAEAAAAAAAARGPEFDEEIAAQEEQFGAPPGAPGQWASALRVVEPRGLTTTCVEELDGNEAVTAMCFVRFDAGHARGWLLAVGTAEGMTFFPTDCQAGYIRLYRCARVCVFVEGGAGLCCCVAVLLLVICVLLCRAMRLVFLLL